MKMILHDWSDDECIKILSNIYSASPKHGTVLIAEHLVPGPETPHFSKLFDIHMMCAVWKRANNRGICRIVKKSWLETCQYISFTLGIDGSNRR
jgi:hypothetical protein